MKIFFLSLRTKLIGILLSILVIQSTAFSADTSNFGVAVQGYDVVGYFTDNKPVKGNGDHVVFRDGIAYLFANDEDKKLFEANPDKYLPQYGGWCAFGTAVGKKIPSDPTAWKIVDGKLYLNLSDRVQKIWSKDISGYIKKADANWIKIKDENPSNL
ncbi:TPA: YHS domain protein [Legionella pneumophila subsp. pneumophila]|nr:YHS domain protein [Legionella pneumophila]HAT9084929.1 YHS domain protein [Legionella pneumophila subsp. pneumophila]HAU9911372.1 YHS domain protein [Legionella pneumophila]HAV1167792.1 YHS domain protein [Legionella pneumophila]